MRTIPLLIATSLLCSQLSGEVFYRLTSGLDDSLSYTEARISLFSQGSLVRVINGDNNRYIDALIRQQQNTPGIKLSSRAFDYLQAIPGETLLVRLVRAAKPEGIPSREASSGPNLLDIEQPPQLNSEATGQSDNTLIIRTPGNQEEIPLFDRRRPQRQSWDSIRTEQRSPLAADVPSSPSSTDEIRQMREGEVLTLNRPPKASPPLSRMPDSALPPSPSSPRGPAPQPLWPETRVIRQKKRSAPPLAPSQRPQVNNPSPETPSTRETPSLVPPPVPLPRATPAAPLLPSRRETAQPHSGSVYGASQPEQPSLPGASPATIGRDSMAGEERAPTDKEVWTKNPLLPPLPPSGWVLRTPSAPLAPPLAPPRSQRPTEENLPPPAPKNKTQRLYDLERQPLGPAPQPLAPRGGYTRPLPPPPAGSVTAPLSWDSTVGGSPQPSYYIQVGVYRKLSSISRFLASYADLYPYQIDRIRFRSNIARRCRLGPFSLPQAQAILPQIKRRVHDAYLVDQRRKPYRALSPAR